MTANMFLTFNLVAFIFVFFRMRSLENARQMAHQIFHDFHLAVAPQFIAGYFTIILAMMLGYFLHLAPASWSARCKRAFTAVPFWIQAIILAIIILIIIQVRQSDIVPFIYLQY